MNDVDENKKIGEDCVIVVIKHENSIINNKYEISDFQCDNIKNIIDLTEITGNIEEKELLNKNNFRQILKVELQNTGKDKIIEVIEQIEKLSFVESVSPNYEITICSTLADITPNDPKLEQQYALDKILAKKVWNYTTGNSRVKVGIIDTGIDSTHPDLKNNVDASLGADFIGDGYGTLDPNGHGTHVAGIIGASGNDNYGIAGICWNVTMIPLRAIGSDGKGNSYDVVRAINHAINNNISILNYSGGKNENYFPLLSAISNYNGILITSAGNASSNNDDIPYYPASYDLHNIISVAATYDNDNLMEISNYGKETVDLGAPGSFILSTYPNERHVQNSGTSMATAYVTGAVALLKSYFPGLTTEQLKWAILEGVDRCSSLENKTVSGGRLNIYNSFMELIEYKFVEDRVVAGDFNGDGKDDVATMYDYGQLIISIHTWKSSGNTLLGMEEWYRSGVDGS